MKISEIIYERFDKKRRKGLFQPTKLLLGYLEYDALCREISQQDMGFINSRHKTAKETWNGMAITVCKKPHYISIR